jgi:hypothetical protein
LGASPAPPPPAGPPRAPRAGAPPPHAARREAERREANAISDAIEAARAEAVARLAPGELEAIVDQWIETEASTLRANTLAMRTPAERVASVLRMGEIDHVLVGVGA